MSQQTAPDPVCNFCHWTAKSEQGLRSHLAQKVACQDKLARLIEQTMRASNTVQPPRDLSPPTEDEDNEDLQYGDNDLTMPEVDFAGAEQTLNKRARVHHDANTLGECNTHFVEPYPRAAGQRLRCSETTFDAQKREMEGSGLPRYGLFGSEAVWDVAEWAHKTLGCTEIDDFLKLKKVGVARREGLACTLRDDMTYAPHKIFEDMEKEKRVWEEMHTADWWWDVQGELELGANVAPIILASDKT
ncbi:unnamed protein product [Peniophora sp. CBMAI 1063]|nr:unnamed protein product [Peniophora sp. CBMAI 1063]